MRFALTRPTPVDQRQGSTSHLQKKKRAWSEQSSWNESADPHSLTRASPLPSLLSSNSARSLVPVAPPVHRLDIVGMVVSPGSSHASPVDMIGNDVVEVGEFHMADCAFLVLFDNLAIEQPSHLRVGAEFPVNARDALISSGLTKGLSWNVM